MPRENKAVKKQRLTQQRMRDTLQLQYHWLDEHNLVNSTFEESEDLKERYVEFCASLNALPYSTDLSEAFAIICSELGVENHWDI